MHIIIGSKNKAKVRAVQTIFNHAEITTIQAPSHVRAQPLTNEETRKGAIHRAKACFKQNNQALCIGLEGGVTMMDDELYLCSWGALVVHGKLFTAGGANLPLPAQFIQPLQAGIELSELMESYTNIRNIRHHEGAVGIFTNHMVSRSELFAHIVKLLKGQWEYYVKSK